MKLFEYKGELVSVIRSKYHSGGANALVMNDYMGMPFATVTINLPEYCIGDNDMIIKNYSENTGVYNWLLEHNICSKVKFTAHSGFITAPVVELYPEDYWTGYKEYSLEELEELYKNYTF